MSFDSHANFGYSTVRTAPTPSATGTSLTVASAQGALFPAVPFNATVWPNGLNPLASNAEIVRVTNITGDVFTIVRHQEGTTARSIGINDQIAATITAKTLTDVETAIPASTATLPDSTDKRYVTDAELVVLGNTSGTNTGDQTSVSGNAGTATKLATARNISGHPFDGTADISLIASDVGADASGAAAAAQAASQPLDSDLTTIAALDSSTSGAIATDGAGWVKKTYTQFKTALALVKADVGLGSVDNTADTAKPVSTAQQTAIDAKVEDNITDGHTTVAPSGNAVFDALALKAPLASPTFTGTVTVPTPTNDTDASTKAYVDATAQGLSVKQSVRLATAAALPGVNLVGSTLVAVGVGVLTIDGQAVALNDRILVKDQIAQAQNGIYKCTTAGTSLIAFVLTRATDSDTSAEIVGAFAFVEEGTANADSGFVNTNTGTITVGTTAITYTQFSGAGEITAGAGLSKSGNTLSAIDIGLMTDAATTKTTPVNADELPLADSAASFLLKKLTLTNLKAFLKTYFDSLYPSGSGTSSGTNTGDQTITLTGDVTGSGSGSFATTLGAVVDGTKMLGWTVNAQTNTSYTLGSNDRFKIITLNNTGPITLTVPVNSSVAIPVGTEVICTGIGAGRVTVAPDGGVSINIPTGSSLTFQRYQIFRLVKVATNTWEIHEGSRPPDGLTIDFSAGGLLELMGLTGDVTTNAGNPATTIAASAVTNAKMADMAAKTVKMRHTNSAGPPEDTTMANLWSDLGVAITTRSIWVPASKASSTDSGTFVTVGTAPNSIDVVQLADAATQGFYSVECAIPKDASAAQPLNIRIVWGPGSTDGTAHTVRWSVDVLNMAAAAGIVGAGITTAFTGSSAARTANVMVIETSTQIRASVTADDVIRINIRRLGSDGADTYVGAVNVIGFFLDYTASI